MCGERGPLPAPVHADCQPEPRSPDRFDPCEQILDPEREYRRDAQQLRRLPDVSGEGFPLRVRPETL